jgi:N-acetylglucosamine-6-phosphate deacetylase
MEIRPEGKIVVPNLGVLAGSWAFTDLCVANAMRLGGVSLADAVAMATDRPRQLLGLPVPTLDAGQPADLVLFDLDDAGNLQVRCTIIGGEVVHGAA